MRKFYCHSFYVLAILGLIGCTNSSSNLDNFNDEVNEKKFDVGVVENQVYKNHSFNISFNIPEEWDLVDANGIHGNEFLENLDSAFVDTLSILILYMTENGKRIYDYSLLENQITALDSANLLNQENKEEYYIENYPHLVESPGFFLEIDKIHSDTNLLDPVNYLNKIRDDISQILLWEKINSRNYDMDNQQVGEVYSLDSNSENIRLFAFDTNYEVGSDLTGISFEKHGYMWNFQLFYFNDFQKKELMDVVKSITLIRPEI